MKRTKNKSSKPQFHTKFHVKDGSNFKEVDPSSRDWNANENCFFYVIAREEIEACDTTRLLHDLRPEPDNPFVKAGPGTVIFSVSGYDEDPRGLLTIPEVRYYFSKVQQKAPCWLYFAMLGHGWPRTVLVACTNNFSYVHGQSHMDMPQDEIMRFFQPQIKECIRLCKMMNVDPDIIEEHLQGAMEDITPEGWPWS